MFAFERLNGILGSVCTNHREIEIQLMQKFISNQQILQKLNSESTDDCLKELLQPFRSVKGSLKHEEMPELPLQTLLSSANCGEVEKLNKLLPPIKEGYP